MLPSILLLLSLPFASQDPQGETSPPLDEPGQSTASAGALKQRIHEMRMNLLLGGDQVRQAEGEAIEFYGQKMEFVDQRLDTLRVELSEKRAYYDLLLDRALSGQDPAQRRSAMLEASKLRAELSSLEAESSSLVQKRQNLAKLVSAVESRDRERERLVAQLETSGDFDQGLGFPLASVGLAPVGQLEASSTTPLEDDQLVQDLLKRDPRGARRILFELDPVRYWHRFPLRPPAAVLPGAIPFPLPDLPGRR